MQKRKKHGFIVTLLIISLLFNIRIISQWQQSEFIIGAFRNPYLTGIHDQDTLGFGLAKRAHFNLLTVYNIWNLNYRSLSGQTYMLNLAAEYGLKCFSNDARHCEIDTHTWWIDGSASNGIFNPSAAANIIADYKTNLPTTPRNLRDVLYGYKIFDEPSWGTIDLNNLLSWVNYLKINDPGKVAYINLLPYYAIYQPDAISRGFNSENDYIQYLDNYLVNPIGNNKLELIGVDNYLNSWFPGSTNNPVRYFYNFDLIRKKAGPNSVRSAIPWWGYVDVFGDPLRLVDSSYIKFSVYTHLAYGAKGIIYFPYDHYINGPIGLVQSGETTYKYSCVKKINNYIKNVIGHALLSSHSFGTYHKTHFYDINNNKIEDIPLDSRIEKSPFVTNLSSERAMVGEFYDETNKIIYLMVVNKGYHDNFPTINVNVELPGDLRNKVFTTSTTGTPNWNYNPVSTTFSNNFTYFTVSNLLPGEGRLYKVVDCGLGMWDWQSSQPIYGDDSNIPVPADYDGDGKTDLAVKNSLGQWKIDYASNGFGIWDVSYFGYGDANSIPVPADYDGDCKADLAVKNSSGQWKIDYVFNGFGNIDVTFVGYGDASNIPVPADYDGDKKTDLSVKNSSEEWKIDFASNGFGSWDNIFYNYGGADAHPVPADYDGDGKADLSIKADWGSWFINFAANGFANGWDLIVSGYGDVSYTPVPADYDGDGKTDLSVKSNTGEWKIDFAYNGTGNFDDLNYQYGNSDAHPISGDYNGDGACDFSVKTVAGNWLIDYSGFKQSYLNKSAPSNNKKDQEKTDDFLVINNYPNPFNPSTTIEYQVFKGGYVIIKIFDILGNEIETIEDGYKKEGRYSVTFDGKYLSSGTYFYNIRLDNVVKNGKMLLLK